MPPSRFCATNFPRTSTTVRHQVRIAVHALEIVARELDLGPAQPEPIRPAFAPSARLTTPPWPSGSEPASSTTGPTWPSPSAPTPEIASSWPTPGGFRPKTASRPRQ